MTHNVNLCQRMVSLVVVGVVLNRTINAWKSLPVLHMKNTETIRTSMRTILTRAFVVLPHQERDRNQFGVTKRMSNHNEGETVDQYNRYDNNVHGIKATTSSCCTSGWSVTDDWNRLSQSDNISYDYGIESDTSSSSNGTLMVLNSNDLVTLAALRMQNYGMSSTTLNPFTEEEIWIQNSIQQIVCDKEGVPSIHTNDDLLNTDQFLDDMGHDIAMLIRCSNGNKSGSTLFMDECEILDDHASSSHTSMTTDQQGISSHKRVELHNNTPIYMKDGDFGK
jgi:hypothetical protein